jgi:hypothetical protein
MYLADELHTSFGAKGAPQDDKALLVLAQGLQGIHVGGSEGWCQGSDY